MHTTCSLNSELFSNTCMCIYKLDFDALLKFSKLALKNINVNYFSTGAQDGLHASKRTSHPALFHCVRGYNSINLNVFPRLEVCSAIRLGSGFPLFSLWLNSSCWSTKFCCA